MAWVPWALLAALPALPAEENFTVYTEHPRLLLTRSRLRLLKRERERHSERWTQFEALMAGKARMPEPGFADALYYRVAGDRAAGSRAVAWALGAARDARQLALVFDWCQDLLSGPQSEALAGKLRQAIQQTAQSDGVEAARARVLAAIALAGHDPKISASTLEDVVRRWWEGKIVPALKSGRDPIARDDFYALFEMLHAIRDSLQTDLRDSAPQYFKDLPQYHLLAYYPASYPAGENDYRIQAARKIGEPDLERAALARAADLAIVSYDLNSPGGQILQGWLTHDRFLLRGTFGAPYEFLWANPYQPGLSYYHVPLVFYDSRYGRLFARSSWDEGASWLGVFDGAAQLFQNGRAMALNPQLSSGAVSVTEAVVYSGTKFRALLKKEEAGFLLGLKPGGTYQVEVDDEEVREQTADPAGILALDLPHGRETGVRVRER